MQAYLIFHGAVSALLLFSLVMSDRSNPPWWLAGILIALGPIGLLLIFLLSSGRGGDGTRSF